MHFQLHRILLITSRFVAGGFRNDFVSLQKQQLLPTAYVVRREGYVLTRVCPSVCPHPGQGAPARVPPIGPGWGVPPPIRPGQGGTPTGGGYPTSVVLDTPRSVCLLRSRRRTFLFRWYIRIASLHSLQASANAISSIILFSLRIDVIFTDHVRSTREGNAFTGVCNSVEGKGGRGGYVLFRSVPGKG